METPLTAVAVAFEELARGMEVDGEELRPPASLSTPSSASAATPSSSPPGTRRSTPFPRLSVSISLPSADPKGKKDYSMAIVERKKSLNRLVVDETTDDDNSVFALHLDTMERLQLFRGDTVLLKMYYRTARVGSSSQGG